MTEFFNSGVRWGFKQNVPQTNQIGWNLSEIYVFKDSGAESLNGKIRSGFKQNMQQTK